MEWKRALTSPSHTQSPTEGESGGVVRGRKRERETDGEQEQEEEEEGKGGLGTAGRRGREGYGEGRRDWREEKGGRESV